MAGDDGNTLDASEQEAVLATRHTFVGSVAASTARQPSHSKAPAGNIEKLLTDLLTCLLACLIASLLRQL